MISLQINSTRPDVLEAAAYGIDKNDMIIDCKVMVGGAVLTESYAKMIGADFYASDARQGVKIALDYFSENLNTFFI